MRTSEYIFFLPSKVGGVLSVVKSYVEELIKQEIYVTVVLTYSDNSICSDVTKSFGLSPFLNLSVFKYSFLENRMHVLKRLSRCIHKCNAVLICNDFIEIEMINAIEIKNPAVLVVHGDYDYYYDLVKFSSGFIDEYFSVSPAINDKIKKLIPERYNNAHYIQYIVRTENPNFNSKADGLNAIFVGRLSKAKGFDVLVRIAEKLAAEDLDISWTIVGQPMQLSDSEKNWLKNINVKHFDFLPNSEVLKEYLQQDILLLPSLFEGNPVVVVEAMKSGVVPIVNDLPTIAPDILLDSKTGFRIKNQEIDYYLSIIKMLYQDKNCLEALKKRAASSANALYDTRQSIDFFIRKTHGISKRNKVFFKRKFSRLDKKYVPNIFVKSIRTLLRYSKFACF